MRRCQEDEYICIMHGISMPDTSLDIAHPWRIVLDKDGFISRQQIVVVSSQMKDIACHGTKDGQKGKKGVQVEHLGESRQRRNLIIYIYI